MKHEQTNLSRNGQLTLNVRLLSDATFFSHSPASGIVDTEVVHDRFGMPYIPAKTLQGLLRDAWLTVHPHFPDLEGAARQLFGEPGSVDDTGMIYVGDGELPDDVKRVVVHAVQRDHNPLSWRKILNAFTDVRYQTSVDRRTGAPEKGSLRAERVVVRGTAFHAPIVWLQPFERAHRQCLALAVLGVRHVGLARNRGRGHVEMSLSDGWATTCLWARGDDGHE